MAGGNYYLCDICKAKTFYDADFDWWSSGVGDLVCLCSKCAERYEVVIRSRDVQAEVARVAALEAEAERLKCCGNCAYTQYGWASGFRCYARSPYRLTMPHEHCHVEWFDGESLWAARVDEGGES
jgi:hypothetical protein